MPLVTRPLVTRSLVTGSLLTGVKTRSDGCSGEGQAGLFWVEESSKTLTSSIHRLGCSMWAEPGVEEEEEH